jgi:putative ABC transport system permease protein
VVLAVFSTTLLADVGVDVVETVEEKFDAAGRDIWVTGGAVQFAPGSIGGVQNSIRDSYTVAREPKDCDDVGTVGTSLFQTVYVNTDRRIRDNLDDICAWY